MTTETPPANATADATAGDAISALIEDIEGLIRDAKDMIEAGLAVDMDGLAKLTEAAHRTVAAAPDEARAHEPRLRRLTHDLDSLAALVGARHRALVAAADDTSNSGD